MSYAILISAGSEPGECVCTSIWRLLRRAIALRFVTLQLKWNDFDKMGKTILINNVIDDRKAENMIESVWSKTVTIPKRKALSGNQETEVAVIGAGMAGILTAYFLRQAGKEVIVLEADRIASGQTKNTTAKITSQHGRIYSRMMEDYGVEKTRLYAKANEAAMKAYEQIIDKNHIACDFERLPAYLYSTCDKKALKKEAELAASLGIKAYYTEENELPFAVAGAVCFENQAQFHPLKFIKGIAEELTIYEQTKVLSVKKHCIETTRGNVMAKHIVFATHYPITNIPGFYFLRQHQERSYVLAVSNVKRIEGMYYSMDQDGLSLRMEGEVLLLGGGGHRTGQEGMKKEEGYNFLRSTAKKIYPGYKEISCWSAQDCLPHDNLPFIGRYSMLRPYWYVATGFKKWGMTASMLSAMIICDQICGVENTYEKLFTPKRLHFKTGFYSLMKDVRISAAGLVKGAFHFPFQGPFAIKPGQGKIVRIGFRRYGCYKEDNGKIHKISVRCPHMGCELEWNGIEQTWDCPCHGSRFDVDGNLIDNPAQKNL